MNLEFEDVLYQSLSLEADRVTQTMKKIIPIRLLANKRRKEMNLSATILSKYMYVYMYIYKLQVVFE